MAVYCSPARLESPPGDHEASSLGSMLRLASSERALLILAADQHDRSHTHLVREAVVQSLRGWADGKASKNQGDFWRLLNSLTGPEIDLAGFSYTLNLSFPYLSIHDHSQVPSRIEINGSTPAIFTTNWDDVVESSFARTEQISALKWAQLNQSFLVLDGQHRLFASKEARRDISARLVRHAISRTATELETSEDINCLTSLFEILNLSLSVAIAGFVRLRTCFHFFHWELEAESTRQRVMDFRIRTGSSPPAHCLADQVHTWAQALMSIPRKSHEKVQMSQGARSVRNSFRARRSQPRFHQSARNNWSSARRAQLAGRGRRRPHRSLAQVPRMVRYRGCWKMARAVRMERRFWSLRDRVEAALGGAG